MVPLLLVIVLALAQGLAYGAARESAQAAAQAGALAIAQEQDPEAAARASVPDLQRSRLRVAVRSRAVEATVRPATVLPGLAALLAAHARADAGAP